MELPDTRTFPKLFALDSETHDPDLDTEGPGFITRESYPIGVGIVTEHTGFYYPFAHKTEGNLPTANFVGWLNELVSDPDRICVMANARYDIEALWKIGVSFKCRIVDIQAQDALIDENQFNYSLNTIAVRRGVGEKASSV